MENIKPVRIIDMNDFGWDGTLTIRAPNARKNNEFKNAMSKYLRYERGNMVLKEDVPMGDMEIAMAMSYVRDAPFQTTIEGFLGFCDMLDDQGGDSSALLDTIQRCIMEVDGDSPFADSPSAGTESSE